MKIIKNGVKAVFFCLSLFCAALFIMIFVLSGSMSGNYRINKGETFSLKSIIPITANFSDNTVKTAAETVGEKYEVDLKIFGIIPFSTVNVEVVDKNYVCVLGQPFGMRIYTEGVLVVDTKNVVSFTGEENPAKKAGIRVGDYILSIDGNEITSNEEMLLAVEKSGGKSMRFEIQRDNRKIFANVKPVVDKKDQKYHIGIYIRDSSAGIGTLTFYSPSNNCICGLGHGLNDSDTGELLKINSGQMVAAEILSVKKGKKGEPGELCGRFTSSVLAEIDKNMKNGVYGISSGKINSVNLTEVAMRQEVEEGEAQILCTVSGEKPQLYSCIVEKHTDGIFSGQQKLTVTVTDKKLLSKAGGIVQGMSGSPILQNGRLIGAITHVLVDDPTTGYAIFAENMLETAQGVASENKLKDAS